MPNRRVQFLRFAAVGVAGFVADAGAVTLLVRGLGVGPYEARVGSYLCAVTTTWWLNRHFTFHSTSPPLREFVAFLLANSLGAFLNLGVYAAIIAWQGSAGWIPVVAVAAGSFAGLCANFLMSSKMVFSIPRARKL
jgi:putative flippase GtrA